MSKSLASLRDRVFWGVVAYSLALSTGVVVHGYLVHEHAEALVWETLLNTEMDEIIARGGGDLRSGWGDSETVRVFLDAGDEGFPAELRGLIDGLHDELMVGGVLSVVLIRDTDAGRLALVLDITGFEQREFDIGLMVIASALLLIVLVGLASAWGANRLVRPLVQIAGAIGRLQPARSGQRVELPEGATTELEVIAGALNDYLQRNDRFIDRERAFIDTASHELRTPLAVIGGSCEIALQQPQVPEPTRAQLLRVQQTVREVEQLISLLLVLAKDPARIATLADHVSLDQLLHEIVDDHAHLTRDKDLQLDLAPLPACSIRAPLPIVQAAIGNLLRNAIENSDRGTIDIRLESPATVVISDPGHGMTPEEISRVYARLARGARHRGGGIGLDLIARLCEHLGWQLELRSDGQDGTTAILRLAGEAPDDASQRPA